MYSLTRLGKHFAVYSISFALLRVVFVTFSINDQVCYVNNHGNKYIFTYNNRRLRISVFGEVILHGSKIYRPS